MKVNIYYGGRGILDDPTLFVINRMESVLKELNVTVERYNLYELKNMITTLPKTLKDADGVILATTIEWYGIGGYMMQFLDSCWLYGDKEAISNIYMCPVVMSTTYGEREGKLQLASAWEILGGRPCSGICGYIADTVSLEMSEEYQSLIEKKAENLYRTMNQKMVSFPASNQAVKKSVSLTKSIPFSPQETEQLSQYISDDQYVQQQKQDIQDLAAIFRSQLEQTQAEDTTAYVAEFRKHFTPQKGFKANYRVVLDQRKKNLIIKINGDQIDCYYGEIVEADVELRLDLKAMDEITEGRLTFQNAFMDGTIKLKGNFSLLRSLDQLFDFR